MPTDFTQLDAAIADLTAQVASTETVEASADTLIEGFAVQVQAAVADALTKDAAANAASIAAANNAIEGVVARFKASGDKLAAAVVAGTPNATPPAA